MNDDTIEIEIIPFPDDTITLRDSALPWLIYCVPAELRIESAHGTADTVPWKTNSQESKI